MDFQSMIRRINDLMRGRNGSDEIGLFAVLVSCIVLIIALVSGIKWLNLIALAAVCYACWRMMSTRLVARRRENEAFLNALGPVGTFLRRSEETTGRQAPTPDGHAYQIISCPHCSQRVRVPLGKGRIRVTCPTCGEKFDALS